MSILFVWILSFVPFGTFMHAINESLNLSAWIEGIEANYNIPIQTDSTRLPIPTLRQRGEYNKLKQAIDLRQKEFQQAYQIANDDDAKQEVVKQAGFYITAELLNGLFPYWYGTTWAFDGYTARPNQGTIGCSYFVSTTLLHVGFNLNRYKLAQQGPLSEARSLALDNAPLSIDLTGNFDGFSSLIEEKCEEGLYFIGLGHSHVGYLFYREGEIYFIQSSYGKSGNVVIDYANESDVLTTFSNFILVPITTNNSLIHYWLTGEEIAVIKGTD